MPNAPRTTQDEGRKEVGRVPDTEGWRWHMARMHYFRDGESLCGKYLVRILGGGNKPRRPWLTTLPDGEPACEECQRRRTAPEVTR